MVLFTVVQGFREADTGMDSASSRVQTTSTSFWTGLDAASVLPLPTVANFCIALAMVTARLSLSPYEIISEESKPLKWRTIGFYQTNILWVVRLDGINYCVHLPPNRPTLNVLYRNESLFRTPMYHHEDGVDLLPIFEANALFTMVTMTSFYVYHFNYCVSFIICPYFPLTTTPF